MLKIEVDYSKDSLLDAYGIEILKDRYLIPGETSPQDGFARAALAFSDDLEMAQRIYNYASNLWFMFASPVLSNAPVRTGFMAINEGNFRKYMFKDKVRGMPISCFLNYVPDSREGLTDHYAENAWLSSAGGGVGGYWGAVRSNGTSTSNGSRSSGIIPFVKVVDSEMLAFSQGVTRRGSYAAYLDISHPEIEEFLDMRKPTGGDINRKCLNLHHGVNITDAFMQEIEAAEQGLDDSWDLIDPHSMTVVKTVSAKELWIKLLNLRVETGEPYIVFIDTVNRSVPQHHVDRGLYINQSNLCSEITLPTSDERTAVCCLSSVNLEKYEEWKNDANFITDLVRFLDNVLEYFIQNAPDRIAKAINSAKSERSIGLGTMGFHSFLQSKGVPIESALATSWNNRIFKQIKEQAYNATIELAEEKGACPDSVGSDNPVRNSYLLAIAPNASSSIICGNTSPSIEPLRANAFTQKTLNGSHLHKNKYLVKLLEEKGQNNDEVWSSIITNRGSVNHLDFLSDYEKDIFKTALEINQMWLVSHAADRQQYICQSQSLNLFFPANVNAIELHHCHMQSWKKGVKSLYYCRSESAKRPDNVSKQIERFHLEVNNDVCIACEA